MLQSSNELKDFSIAASDGDIGQVEAFCFDDKEWTVLVANTGGWLHPHRLLISPLSARGVDALARVITKTGFINITAKQDIGRMMRCAPEGLRTTSQES